jgi:tRNA pseudouridine38-40 synthase
VPLLLKLAYDGTALSGCPEVSGRRTVVGEVRTALARVAVDATVACLSRTDAGVHARGQLAVATLDRPLPLDRLLLALDRHLPADVRCTAAATVDRVPDVLAKTYRYTLDLSPFGDPFLARRAWRVRLDPARLVPLGQKLVGTHDLSAFRRRDETRVDLVRTIERADWDVVGHTAVLTITGSGFPYRAVRSLVGACLTVARGAATEAELEAALAGVSGSVSRQQAPARGLCLEAIALHPQPVWSQSLGEAR